MLSKLPPTDLARYYVRSLYTLPLFMLVTASLCSNEDTVHSMDIPKIKYSLEALKRYMLKMFNPYAECVQ